MPRPTLDRVARRRGPGFTLIELTVVIAIIAILAGALLPVITQPYLTERRNEAQTEMADIHDAIVGRAEVGDYGYLGTIGQLPVAGDGTTVDLSLLTQAESSGTLLPAATTVNGVVYGWNGPYLQATTLDPLEDPWGHAYHIIKNPLDDTQWAVESAGLDGNYATVSDNLYLPSPIPPATAPTVYWNSQARSVALTVDLTNGSTLEPDSGVEVTLHLQNGSGADAALPPQFTGPAGSVVFDGTGTKIPFGQHYVVIGPPVGGIIRSFVIDRPQTTATVLVPSTFVPLTCTVNAAPVGTTAFGCNGTLSGGYYPFPVPVDGAIEADFSGQMNASAMGSGKACQLEISLTTNPGGTDLNAGYSTVVTGQSSPDAVSTTLTSARLAAGATGVRPSVVVTQTGGVGCTVSGQLYLKVFTP